MAFLAVLQYLFIIAGFVSSSWIRAFHRCICCVDSKRNSVANEVHIKKAFESIFVSNLNKSTFDYLDTVLSSPKTEPSVASLQSISSDIDLSIETLLNRNQNNLASSPIHQRFAAIRESIFYFCYYLHILLRQILEHTTSIQIFMAHENAFKAAEIKTEMAEARRILKYAFKDLAKLSIEIERDEIYNWNCEALVSRLQEQQRKLKQLFGKLSVVNLGANVYRMRMVLLDMTYNVLIRQFHQSLSADVAQTESLYNGFLPFVWLIENGQGAVDYLQTIGTNERIKEYKLVFDLYTAVPKTYLFPILHSIFIFRNFVQLTNTLNLDKFYGFIKHSRSENGSFVYTQFGMVIDACSTVVHEKIFDSEEMYSIRRLIALVGGDCIVLQGRANNKTLIECSTKPIRTRRILSNDQRGSIVYSARHNNRDDFNQLLLQKFGDKRESLTLNYTEYDFNTSYMNSMSVVNFKTIQAHSLIYTALQTMSRTKEYFALTDFVENKILKSAKNERYLNQISEYILSLKSWIKEYEQKNNSLYKRVNEMRDQNKQIDSVRNRLLFALFCTKASNLLPFKSKKNESIAKPTFISPQRMEKSKQFQALKMDEKIERIVGGLIECNIQIDAVILNLETIDITFATRPITFLLSVPTRFQKYLVKGFPSFKTVRIVLQYHTSLKHLLVPMNFGRFMIIMLILAQKRDADNAVFTFKYIDVMCEIEMEFNGEPWSWEMIRAMDDHVRLEYNELNMNTLKRLKWAHRPLGLLSTVHQMGGYCGIRKVGDGINPKIINKAFYCRWSMKKFNPNFDFDRWKIKQNHRQTPFKENVLVIENN